MKVFLLFEFAHWKGFKSGITGERILFSKVVNYLSNFQLLYAIQSVFAWFLLYFLIFFKVKQQNEEIGLIEVYIYFICPSVCRNLGGEKEGSNNERNYVGRKLV